MNVDVAANAAGQTVRRAAVLGSPIKHSLSPVLHGAAYRALDLHGWHYDKIECDEPGLARLVDGMGPEWVGLSLTMPLKRVALAVADEVSPLARAVGAANTLVFPAAGPAGGSQAHNTDVAGLVAALQEAGLARTEQAVILGAGGTAQSALAAVRELGHQSPIVLVRNLARTGELRETAERLGMRPTISGGLFAGPLPAANLVISTLPGGAADPLSATRWKPRHRRARCGVRAMADPLRRVSPGRRLPGGQRSHRAAVPGGCAGGADDWSSRPGGGDADRPGRRGGGPPGLNQPGRAFSRGPVFGLDHEAGRESEGQDPP